MERIDGVNLFEYQRHQVCIDLGHVKYFCAVALTMIETLHRKGIVFRDLKPENIMLQKSSAYMKLVDFGFAKQISKSDRTFTKCGSPGYSAPEVL